MFAQRLPPDYKKKIVQFQRFIIKQQRAQSYPLHLVANMDKFNSTCHWIELSAKQARKLKIRTTGNEKNRLMVVLTCAGDGSKPKPLVIFKRKAMPQIAVKQRRCCCAGKRMDGWMEIWKFGLRNYGNHDLEDLEGEGVFLCWILSKPTRLRKSSVRLNVRTQI